MFWTQGTAIFHTYHIRADPGLMCLNVMKWMAYAPFRIEYRRAGTLAIINLLCSPLAHAFSWPIPLKKCSILLTEMPSKSPCYIK